MSHPSEMSAADAQILERLHAGEPVLQVQQALQLDPVDFVRVLVRAALDSDEPAECPALTQSRPRRPWLADALGEAALVQAFPRAARPARLALAAALYQIHDFWDASHEAAQHADDLGERNFSTYWHGIAHRREPDASNASYWFRRVGRHPIFPRLADEARPLITASSAASQAASLLQGDSWNPFAFIELCGAARPGTELHRLALALQRLEMIALFDATLKAVV